MLRRGAAGAGLRRRGQPVEGLGRTGSWLQLAGERARHLRRRQGLLIDHRKRAETDGQILKFTRDGNFVLQIGKVGAQTGNSDTTRLGRAAGVEVMLQRTKSNRRQWNTHNRRVIVFDADTVAYKRHLGAYGKPSADADKPDLRRAAPPTAEQLQQFGNPVHCVRLSRDGTLYVCDRINDRVQIFRKDGTYVKEFAVEPRTAANGSVWDIVLSRDPDQRWIVLADGRNNQVL